MDFLSSPIAYQEKFHFEDEYIDSLKSSIDYFLNCVSKEIDIEKNHFETSLSTNQLIFDIENIPT